MLSMENRKTRVMGVRIPEHEYNKFEILCLEQKISMSDVFRSGYIDFMSKFEVQPKDKSNLHNRGL